MLNRRFYEGEPTVKKAVNSLLLFPDEFQRIIASGFTAIAVRDCNANELLKDSGMLGSERVLALYKSKRKRRKYDHNIVVHGAMNYLLVMNENNRLFLAGKVIELIGFMQEYLKICKDRSVVLEIQAVEKISSTYVEHGAEATGIFMVRLDAELQKRVPEKEPSANTKVDSVKSVIEGYKAPD